MMTMGNQGKGKKILLLVPALFAAVLMGFMFLSCDVGDEPDPPTGPETVYDPDFDEARPGITARVSPSTITVPGNYTGGKARAVMYAVYRDPNGQPVPGLQINFKGDSQFTGDTDNRDISFRPAYQLTDGSGAVSTEVMVDLDTPQGSYTLVAFTSPASGGPNAQGQTILKVTSEWTVLYISTASLGPWDEGVGVTDWMVGGGGVPPYTWSATGAPDGVSLASDGSWSGSPDPETAGTYSVTVTLTDSTGDTETRSYAVTVTGPDVEIISATTLPDGQEDVAYSVQLNATGGTGNYEWTQTGGDAFPSGLTLSTSGLISGTPGLGVTAGSYTFTIQVSDGVDTDSDTFTLTINP